MKIKAESFKIGKKAKIALLCVSAIAILVFVVLYISRCGSSNKEEVSVSVETVSLLEPITVEASTVDLHKNKARSRLSGLWIDESKVNNTPIAVMYNNVAEAMPQSSISYADVVFESLVEGNITRLCAVFENCNTLEKIGPVRSCRTYYLFFAKEFEAIYVHFGYSEYAEEFLQMKLMHSLDGMVYCNFYRTTDREAPHNAYTSWAGIMESAVYRGYPTQYPLDYVQPFSFSMDDSKDITISDGQKCTSFYPGYSYNKPCFTYNTVDRKYYRSQFDQPQIDSETGNQLNYKNILVKYVGGGYWPGGTPNYTNVGSGKGLFITEGTAIEVKWVKSTEYGSTKYYYADGTEIILNQGKTWICQISDSNRDAVKILE